METIAYIIIGIITLVMAASATYPLWRGQLKEANGENNK